MMCIFYLFDRYGLYYIPNNNLTSSNIVSDNIDIVMPIPNNYYNTYTYK